MTQQEYQERLHPLYTRLQYALRLRCYRTANARLRDIARLQTETNPTTPYATHLVRLQQQYLPDKKNI